MIKFCSIFKPKTNKLLFLAIKPFTDKNLSQKPPTTELIEQSPTSPYFQLKNILKIQPEAETQFFENFCTHFKEFIEQPNSSNENFKNLYEKNEKICELKGLENIRKLIALKSLKLNLHCLSLVGSYYYFKSQSRILKYFTLMTSVACVLQNLGFIILTSFISRRLCKFIQFSEKDNTILFQTLNKNGHYLSKASNIYIEKIEEININFQNLVDSEQGFNKISKQIPQVNEKFYQGCLLQLRFFDEKKKKQRQIFLPIIPMFFSVKNLQLLKEVCQGPTHAP